MPHKHTPHQTSKTIARKTRASLISRLAELLWDQTKPDGEEAVPEDQWETILTGPCNGDKQLIAEVSAYERWLRDGTDVEFQPVEIMVSASYYIPFVFEVFQVRSYPIHLLWNIETSDWYPEDQWDQLLEHWEKGTSEQKGRMKEHALRLKKVRETGRYTYYM